MRDCREGFDDYFGEVILFVAVRFDVLLGNERGRRGMLGVRCSCMDLGRGIRVLDWEYWR